MSASRLQIGRKAPRTHQNPTNQIENGRVWVNIPLRVDPMGKNLEAAERPKNFKTIQSEHRLARASQSQECPTHMLQYGARRSFSNVVLITRTASPTIPGIPILRLSQPSWFGGISRATKLMIRAKSDTDIFYWTCVPWIFSPICLKYRFISVFIFVYNISVQSMNQQSYLK